MGNDLVVSGRNWLDLGRGAIPLPFKEDILLKECHVENSLMFDDLACNLDGIEVGDELVLRREPENAGNGFSILVLTGKGECLGRVPESCSEIPARLMDAGKLLYAKLMQKDSEPILWVDLKIAVYLREM